MQSQGTRYGGAEDIGSTGDNHRLSGLLSLQDGDDADRRLSVVLQLLSLRDGLEAQTRRLLRILLLRDRALSDGAIRHLRAINIATSIGPSVHIVGEVRSDDDLLIEGRIEGRIYVGQARSWLLACLLIPGIKNGLQFL